MSTVDFPTPQFAPVVGQPGARAGIRLNVDDAMLQSAGVASSRLLEGLTLDVAAVLAAGTA